MKRLSCIAILVISICFLASCSGKGTKNHMLTVGISQLADTSQSNDCRKGIVQGLREKGFIEGKNIIFKLENAKGNLTTVDKISQKYKDDRVDLIVAIGTTSAKSAVNFVKDGEIPIVYACVSDPAAAGFTDKSMNPIVNATGTIDKVAVKDLLDATKIIKPSTKNIGIIYTKTEEGSKRLINEFKFYGTSNDINIVSMGINKASEIDLAYDTLAKKVDGIVLINDNIVSTVTQIIIDKSKARKMPVYGIEKSQIESGAIYGYTVNYLECGKETGRIAGDILLGEKARYIRPHEVDTKDISYNEDAARTIGLTIPNELK